MWRLIFSLALVLTCANASGQGKVSFGNDTAHLFYYNGGALPSNGSLKAVLYAGRTFTNLTLQSSVVLSGAAIIAPGRMANQNVILQSIPGGAVAYFKIFILDTATPTPSPIDGNAGWNTFLTAGDFGTSGLFTAIPGSSLSYPPLVSGYSSASTWTGPIYVGGCLECFPPSFVTNPSNAVVRLGSNVTLSALAAHYLFEPITYQWRKQFVAVAGATNSQFALTNVTLADAGGYDVIAGNSFGSTVSPVASVTVAVPAVLGTSSYNANNNQFQFTVTGAPGTNYIVQVSTNLSTTDWMSVFTNTAPFTFVDSNANSFPQRFYRAYSP